MTRLPRPGQDADAWGTILNEFLSVEHNSDGTLKKAVDIAAAASNDSVIHNSGDETIGGIKSFLSSPLVPTPNSPTAATNKTYVDSAVGANVAPDASTTTKGVIKLAGDLAGTALLPTVPGLAAKEPAITPGTTGQYYRGDKSFQTLDKTAVGLANVDNTSDANKPVSSATSVAIKAPRRRERPLAAVTNLISGVMASPPTIGAIASSTAISSPASWATQQGSAPLYIDPRAPFDYQGVSSGRRTGGTFPDYNYVSFDSPTRVNMLTAFYTARFYFDGTTLEITFKNVANCQWQLYVDGLAISSSPTQVTGTPTTAYLPITFGTRARRLIEFRSNMPFGGVVTGPLDTVWKPSPVGGPRCVILGDSYTSGTGADAPSITGWPQTFARIMGWPDTWGAGIGGSGYLNTGLGQKFIDRVAADITANAPDIVIVAGGHNDSIASSASFTTTALQDAALTLFQAIKAGTPNCKLIVIGPMGQQSAQSTYVAMQTAMFTAAAGYADLTVDTMGAVTNVRKNWFFGTGYQGSPAGNGNGDNYIWTDNIHPSQAGHDYIAHRIAAEVTSLLAA